MNKRVIFIILLVIVAIGLIFSLRMLAPKEKNTVKETQAFTPPVYVSGDSPTQMTMPLYLQRPPKGELQSLTPEQEKSVADFKRKILSRVSSGTALAVGEKNVINISLSTTTTVVGSLVLANQIFFHFSDDEVGLISAALKK